MSARLESQAGKRLPARQILIVALTLATLAITVEGGQTAVHRWESLADGIELRRFKLPGPNVAFVARMDRGNPNVTIDSSIAEGLIWEGRETVSQMAERYEGTINAWGGRWGPTNRVVVAINGSFHNTETGVAEGGIIHSGWYAKRYRNLEGGSGFVWRSDGDAFVGECIGQPESGQVLTFLSSGETMPITQINGRRNNNRIIIYTPQFGKDTGTGKTVVEVLVQLEHPLQIQPSPNMTVGTVRDIRIDQGSTELPFDHVVIAARGETEAPLLDHVRIGEKVGFSFKVDHFASDCKTVRRDSWKGAYANIAGSFVFLRGGKIKSFDDPGAFSPHPRTAVCLNEDYIYFVVVDGRQPDYSVGMTTEELGEFCRDTLGATWGINQDGGGSSAMWANGEIVNWPSDGAERQVANGLMMILTEPVRRSGKFSPGDLVLAREATRLRLGPGTNFGRSVKVGEGESLTVLAHANNLEGVFATGQNWWLVASEGREGWIPESSLRPSGSGTAGGSPQNLQSEFAFLNAFRALFIQFGVRAVPPVQP